MQETVLHWVYNSHSLSLHSKACKSLISVSFKIKLEKKTKVSQRSHFLTFFLPLTFKAYNVCKILRWDEKKTCYRLMQPYSWCAQERKLWTEKRLKLDFVFQHRAQFVLSSLQNISWPPRVRMESFYSITIRTRLDAGMFMSNALPKRLVICCNQFRELILALFEIIS